MKLKILGVLMQKIISADEKMSGYQSKKKSYCLPLKIYVFATVHIMVNATIIAFWSYFISIGHGLKDWCEPVVDSLGNCRSVLTFFAFDKIVLTTGLNAVLVK